MSNVEKRLEYINNFNHYYENKNILKEYFYFSKYIQSLFTDENSQLNDFGNFQRSNLLLINRLEEKIKKHPYIFKLLFGIK